MKNSHKEHISKILIDMYYPEDDIYYIEPTRFEKFVMKLKQLWYKMTRRKIHSKINGEDFYDSVKYRHRSFRDVWNE